MENNTLRSGLKNYILQNGIKEKWIASEIGVSPSLISHYLAGRRNLSATYTERLIEVLQKS